MATGGLFGTQQPQTQPTTGLFGQPTNPGLGAGGSSLGSAAPNNTQPTTGLFGQPQPTSGGLFGQNQPAAQAQPTTGGLFGNQPQNTSGSGGLFGGAATTGATGGGLFGNGGATATTGGLFGNQQQQQQQQPAATAGLFGNPSATTQPAATTSGFGSNLFGPKPVTTGPTNAPLTISTLGGPSTSTFPQPAQSTASSPNPIFGKVEEIYNAWNPASPSCRFQVRPLAGIANGLITHL